MPEESPQQKHTDSESAAESQGVPLDWSKEIDTLLASWCDNAKCFEWMHTDAYTVYEKRSKVFMITINCLTALSGVSNIIAGGYNINGFQVAWIFGGISVAASTLSMLQDKLGYQVSSQVHKTLASNWASIRLKIEEIITLPYSGRRDCKTFLRYIKADINKATMDGSSIIPKEIREACFKKFNSIPDFDIPDVCGHMEHTKIYVASSAVPYMASAAAAAVPYVPPSQPLLVN
jgi:hypothetical protein